MLEYLPSTNRAKIVIIIALFWSLGSIFEYLMAMFIVPTYGWRLLTALSALPISIVAMCMYVSIHFFLLEINSFFFSIII
jgi:MFS family permease